MRGNTFKVLEDLEGKGYYVSVGLKEHTPSPSRRGEPVGGIFAFFGKNCDNR